LRSQNPDLKESLEIGRDNHTTLPNNWPPADEAGVAFRETMNSFYQTCQALHIQVMRAIALGLGLPDAFFDSYISAADNNLRLLHYPATPAEVFKNNVGQVRAGKHSDYGTVTLLFQDMRGGLQVRSPQGSWVDATPIKGTIVVNAGDLLARWSNHIIASTEHQVVEPPSEPVDGKHPARYSCA
jgi:isopenicillin N synthase-like dioxygenase